MAPPGFTRPNLCSYALLPGSQSLRSSRQRVQRRQPPTGRRCAPAPRASGIDRAIRLSTSACAGPALAAAIEDFLRAASVVLDTSDELTSTYVMEGDTKDAIAALNKACEIRLMREGPHGEVSFIHVLYLHARAGEWSGRNGAMASAAFPFEQAGQIDQMVQAGYQAASQAERAGMYHTALMLYQKLRPHVSIEELGPRLAGVLIVLGDWPKPRS